MRRSGRRNYDTPALLPEKLVKAVSPGAMILYSPGKLYPGEVNPRWALQILHPDSQEPLGPPDTNKQRAPNSKTLKLIRDQLIRELGLEDRWLQAKDPLNPRVAGLGVAARFQRWKMDHGTMEYSPDRTIEDGGAGRASSSAQSAARRRNQAGAGFPSPG